MSQEQLAQLIHEQTAAIAALEVRISTHETIRRILRVLALEEITLGQALGILAETAERSDDPEQQGTTRRRWIPCGRCRPTSRTYQVYPALPRSGGQL